MGCDIHATIESKERWGGGRWYGTASNITIDSSYALFTVLANVRNMHELRGENHIPISELRGTPTNKSYIHSELIESREGDGHSASWVTFKELKEHKTEWTGYKTEDFYRFMEIVAQRLGEENVRLVFFFDN